MRIKYPNVWWVSHDNGFHAEIPSGTFSFTLWACPSPEDGTPGTWCAMFQEGTLTIDLLPNGDGSFEYESETAAKAACERHLQSHIDALVDQAEYILYRFTEREV